MRRVRVTAYGRVQGVFFRASTRDEARRLGLTGWIENCPDGTVRAEIQGEEQDVETMLGFVRRGPGQSQVDDVSVTDVDVITDDRSFQVR